MRKPRFKQEDGSHGDETQLKAEVKQVSGFEQEDEKCRGKQMVERNSFAMDQFAEATEAEHPRRSGDAGRESGNQRIHPKRSISRQKSNPWPAPKTR